MTTLEDSVNFQPGRPLPSPETLIDLLNRLSVAREGKRLNEKFRLESEIREMVVPGIYEGYLGDDLQVYIVRVVSIKRKGQGANLQTFWIALEVLEGTRVVDKTEMELIDFLRQINRQRPSGGQQVGPRFWPL